MRAAVAVATTTVMAAPGAAEGLVHVTQGGQDEGSDGKSGLKLISMPVCSACCGLIKCELLYREKEFGSA